MAADPERQYVQRQAARSWTDTTWTNVVKRLNVRTAARDGASWLRPKLNQVLGLLRVNTWAPPSSNGKQQLLQFRKPSRPVGAEGH